MDEGREGDELMSLAVNGGEDDRLSPMVSYPLKCLRGANCRGWAGCGCLIDISTPATLERDFNAWLHGSSPSPSSSGTDYSIETSTDYSTDSSAFLRTEYSAEYGTIEGCFMEYALDYTATIREESNLSGEVSPKIRQGSTDQILGGTNLYGRPYCPGRPLSMLERTRIIELHLAGMKVNAISKTLCISHGCVSKIISRYRTTGILSPASAPEQRKVKGRRSMARNDEAPQSLNLHHSFPIKS